MIRKSLILWCIEKFKDAYLFLVLGKLIENMFYKNEVESLINFVKVRLFKVFLKLLGMNYVFQSNVTCELF